MADRRLLEGEALHDVARAERRVLRGDEAVDLQAHRLAQGAQHGYERVARGSGQRLERQRAGAAVGWSARCSHDPMLPHTLISINILTMTRGPCTRLARKLRCRM